MRKFAVAEDRAEYVVEIMRNAARQRTDCLHLLRLPQLRFELLFIDLRLFLRRHIAGRADESQRFSRRVARTAAACGKPMPFAVRVTNAIFAFIAARTSLEMVIDIGLEARQVVGMNYYLRQPFITGLDLGIRALTIEQFHLRRQVYTPRRDVPVPMSFVRSFHGECIALLAVAQRSLTGRHLAYLAQQSGQGQPS